VALVWDGMPCALCGEPLDPDDCFATTHFLDRSHPLEPYSDAAMHWACYDEWPSRPEFSRAYFDAWVEQQAESTTWGLVYRSDRVAVAVSPPPEERFCLSVASAVASVQNDLSAWERLVSERLQISHLRPADRDAVVAVFPELRAALPDADALRSRLDTGPIRTRQRGLIEAQRARDRSEKALLREHQWRWWKARWKRRCPHCGARRAIRAVNRYPAGRSYFVCRSCSLSFDPPERE